jgi:gas vesicle protein
MVLVDTMYQDEWEPVMTAESMKEKIEALAELAKDRTEDGESVEETVRSLTHETYLLKHTTTDVLRELQELVELYQDEFYDGDANKHVMEHINDMGEVEFWYDYPGAALAAGLEWATLEALDTPQKPA